MVKYLYFRLKLWFWMSHFKEFIPINDIEYEAIKNMYIKELKLRNYGSFKERKKSISKMRSLE